MDNIRRDYENRTGNRWYSQLETPAQSMSQEEVNEMLGVANPDVGTDYDATQPPEFPLDLNRYMPHFPPILEHSPGGYVTPSPTGSAPFNAGFAQFATGHNPLHRSHSRPHPTEDIAGPTEAMPPPPPPRGPTEAMPGPTDAPRSSCSAGKRKKLTSDVWEHFDVEYEEGYPLNPGRWGHCKGCRKRFDCQSKVGTSTLRKHANSCALLKAQAAEGVGSSASQVSTITSELHRQWLAKFIIDYDLPINMGESPEYQEFVSHFYPNIRHVSRSTTRADIVTFYEKRKQQLIEELGKGTFCVALTSDVWSGRAKEDYISVVIHFIDNEWTMQKRVIGFRKLTMGHRGEDLAERILAVLTEYNIRHRVISITMDNATNNTRAIDILRPDISGFHEDLVHQRCFLHILNLIVQAGMEDIKPHLDKIRNCISWISNSNRRLENFKIFCRLNGLRPRQFALDMDIRWNSTYLMLSKVLPYKEPLTAWVAQYMSSNTITDEDWMIAGTFHEFLKVFYNLTVSMSAVYKPTTHEVLFSIVSIAEVLFNHRDNPLLERVVSKMEEKFRRYWSSIPPLYSFGLLLDPRMKKAVLHDVMVLLQRYTGINYPEENFRPHQQLFSTVFENYERQCGAEVVAEPQAVPMDTYSANARVISLIRELRNIDNNRAGRSSPGTPTQSSELSRYFRTNHGEFHDNMDVLGWWKINERMYPVLARFARDILSVPVSTISSEGVFSTTGRIIEERRISLKPEMVEMLTLTKDWDRADRRRQQEMQETEELTEYFEDMYFDDEPGPSSSQPGPSSSHH